VCDESEARKRAMGGLEILEGDGEVVEIFEREVGMMALVVVVDKSCG
jgi:hypothetical protein